MNSIKFPLDYLFLKLIKENTIDNWQAKTFLKKMKIKNQFKQ